MPDHPSPDDPTLAAPPRVDRLTGAAASSSDAAPRHDTGRALDTSFPFERGALLGSGGMGDVVAGVDRRLGREVAIKTLQPGHTADARARFLREARITSRLEHPNIVPVHELTTDPAGNLCLVMKVVRGITLDTWIRDRRPPLADRIDVFGRICDAIAFAHAHRIIHRDLKPQNVMIGEFGEVQVMDWGLARELDPASPAQPEAAAGRADAIRGDQSNTLDGSVIGTPAYMPPEQARGDIDLLDERSDIYSLGATLYFMLAGVPPFEGPVLQVLSAVRHGEFAAPSKRAAAGADIPPALEAAVLRAMAAHPADRPPTVTELQQLVRRSPAWGRVAEEMTWKPPAGQDPRLLAFVSILRTARLVGPRGKVALLPQQFTYSFEESLVIRIVVGGGADGLTHEQIDTRSLVDLHDLPAMLRNLVDADYIAPGTPDADGQPRWVPTARGQWAARAMKFADPYVFHGMPPLPERDLLQLVHLLTNFRTAWTERDFEELGASFIAALNHFKETDPDPGPRPDRSDRSG